MISRVATKSKSLRLAALAASIRTGHFDAVIKQIEEILKDMKDEEKRDIERRDGCITERHELNEENATDKHAVKVSKGKVAKKERVIEKNEVSLEEVNTTRADAEKQLKTVSEQREQENADFKEAKTDDETAIGVLDEVLAKLSAFHNDNGAFVQEPEFEVSPDQAPDAKFSDKAHREGESKGIISILEMIQGDLKNEIANGIKDEEAAQKAFEEQKEAIEKLMDALDKKAIALNKSTAERQSEISEETTNIENKNGEIAARDEELDGLKAGCDWLEKNFEKRADRRDEEAAALQSAKGVLAGAEVSLITKHKFDDEQLPSLKFTHLSFLQRA
jgi:chromosome segregation ATPase